MFHKILFAVVALAAVLPTSQSTRLPDLPKDGTTTPTPSLNAIKDEFVQKHPDLVHWVERALARVKEHRNATAADVQEVRQSLSSVREHIYEFVTSPIFFISTDIFIDKAIRVVSPLLGVFPIKEVRQLLDIVKKDPSITGLLVDSDPNILELVPGAGELDKWFVNSTSHILADTMGSVVHKNLSTVTVV